MLVLARRVGQAIIINGGEITIRIMEIRGHCARVAIEAPDTVKVLREELHLRDKREQQDSDEAA